MATPLENLYGIQKRFTDAITPGSITPRTAPLTPPASAPAAARVAPGFQAPNIKINPKGISAKNLALTAAELLADPIIRALPDNPYSDTYIRQQAGEDVRGIFADQVDAVTKPVLDYLFRGDGELPKPRLSTLQLAA